MGSKGREREREGEMDGRRRGREGMYSIKGERKGGLK